MSRDVREVDYAIRWCEREECHVAGPFRTPAVAIASARDMADRTGGFVEVLLDDGTPIACVGRLREESFDL